MSNLAPQVSQSYFRIKISFFQNTTDIVRAHIFCVINISTEILSWNSKIFYQLFTKQTSSKLFATRKKKRKLGKTKSYSIFPFPLLSVIRFFPSCTPLPFQFFSDNFWSSLTSASFTFDPSLHSTYTQTSKGLPKVQFPPQGINLIQELSPTRRVGFRAFFAISAFVLAT